MDICVIPQILYNDLLKFFFFGEFFLKIGVYYYYFDNCRFVTNNSKEWFKNGKKVKKKSEKANSWCMCIV